jgi:hypothetical protein
MPRKIRELKSMLQKAGCTHRTGKGNHTVWNHPRSNRTLVLSGNDGDDAKIYQERAVEQWLRELGGTP